MITPPSPDRYYVAAAAFEETAFTEAGLRELYMQRKITGATLATPVNTAAWKKLSKLFPEWAATPLPPLPPEPPVPPPLSPTPADNSSSGIPPSAEFEGGPYGGHSAVMFLIAVLLLITGLASSTASRSEIVLIFGIPLHWLCIGLGIVFMLFGGLLTFLSDIARRQRDTAQKVDRLLAILEQSRPQTETRSSSPAAPLFSGDGKPPDE